MSGWSNLYPQSGFDYVQAKLTLNGMIRMVQGSYLAISLKGRKRKMSCFRSIAVDTKYAKRLNKIISYG